ncbi:tRNA N(3)-methylcytidine methyltransferase METTL2A [Ambystoma mexicanum]|uniref:tRNA N(3)-methylcytidine methyltransferase METTL2A n=1 Tax=Ambystoma mexicanum TaxID=8296 RepID=UPI0037E8C17C
MSRFCKAVGVSSVVYFRYRWAGTIMATHRFSTETGSVPPTKTRPQFGNRLLTDPSRVFQHNAWDNVEWSEEQEATAQKKVQENSAQLLPPEKQNEYEVGAHGFWNTFYSVHENRFFKDRHWLFTEFPELAPNQVKHRVENSSSSELPFEGTLIQTPGCNKQGICAEAQVLSTTAAAVQPMSCNTSPHSPEPGADQTPSSAFRDLKLNDVDFPGSSASYRILEVGCGVGNTVFPILKTNNDHGLFVYCCDFSSTAVDLVKSNEEYDASRCFAFVHDVTDQLSSFPVPAGSMDIIILIFVLSAILPDKMLDVLCRLSRLLKPGGQIIMRDYGRYDMAQLRFKKGRCLSDNFYVRGDGTRVYFFTQDELDKLLTGAGLEKVQNIVDRRLQVNRGKQLTMYRVWIQCKYRKPLTADNETTEGQFRENGNPAVGERCLSKV